MLIIKFINLHTREKNNLSEKSGGLAIDYSE